MIHAQIEDGARAHRVRSGRRAQNADASRRQSSTRFAASSPTAGPCLKPWPDPPPTTHTLSCPDAVDQEIAVGRVLVLADASSDDRRALHRREPPLDPRTRPSDRVGVRRPVVGVRIDRRTVFVDADFDAAVLESGMPIDARRTIDPCRCVRSARNDRHQAGVPK